MEELQRLLKIRTGPNTDGKEFINVSCNVGFEPHGKASEDWDVYWTLVLPQIQSYWKSINGWKGREYSFLPMSFKGKTFDEVVDKAKNFLKELNDEDK